MAEEIVITGAAGLVGRAVCIALRAQGRSVVPVVRTLAANAPVDSLAVDLTADDLAGAVREPAGLIHLAAAVPHSARYPDSEATAALTRRIDSNVLRAARAWRCPAVYMSTCGLYDRRLEAVKHEDDAACLRVESPYFAAKLAGEQQFLEQAGATVVRLAAPLGPGLKRRLVVARFLSAARGGGTIEVWGSGAREQNFIDARDVAALVTAILGRSCATIVNAASPHPTTMAELAQLVIQVVGRGEVRCGAQPDPREAEVARYSIAKAATLFGWSPRIELRQSLESLVRESFED